MMTVVRTGFPENNTLGVSKVRLDGALKTWSSKRWPCPEAERVGNDL